MKRAEFESLMEQHYHDIFHINQAKGHDYAGDQDALSNFKTAARMLGLTPEQVWGVYFHKHHSAVMTFLKEGQVESEPIEGRIHDCILYLFLLLGLIEDAKA
jgi:hypothetical protein